LIGQAGIDIIGFVGCAHVKEVIFAPGSRVREIHGFCHCLSRARIEFPPSLEIIGMGIRRPTAFVGCPSLKSVVFAENA
jgi:hypothetical protein